MKKFKTFFYGIYILYFGFLTFIAFNYEKIVLHWDWDWISTWTGLIRLVLQLGGFGTILFVTELIIENIHLASKRSKIKSLESEVKDLKAKLYDKANTEMPEAKTQEPVVEKKEDNLQPPASE